ncbi:MAG: alpha-galactosidase [Marinilabiliales bacterium]|nr:alpha-galactosidase [Marinilabiliales bacterium]
MNESFFSQTKGDFILHHSKGSNAERSDFQPFDDPVTYEKPQYLTPSGGRSSDNSAFPFFNLESPDGGGVVCAIGWTGKWYADIRKNQDQSVVVKSGMERMKLFLNPGEEIRTPSVALLFWNGTDRMVGHNQFRQFILSHHTRKIDDCPAKYPVAGSFDYGDPAPCGEYNCLTEQYALALIERYKRFDILPELFWLDAGWYTGGGIDLPKGEWWQNVGNWSVAKERFPNGLLPLAEAAHAVGSRFMVWFEPERVRPNTEIDREHPEWLIKRVGKEDYLFDLGNASARLWLTNRISDIIRKEKIDFYRQDFNFDPLPYWEQSEEPGRKGIREIRHIEGLYAFWDSLLVRFPKLLIDNCASGGRRIDLETTSRSAPLWRTDYQYGEPNGYQCHTYGLHFYLPVHGTAIYKTDNYTFRSGLGTTAVFNWEVTGRDGEPIPLLREKIKEYKELRAFYYADYYPLTSNKNMTADNKWLAYQMNRPGEGDGIVVAFRRKDCGEESITVQLQGLHPKSMYSITFQDYNITLLQRAETLQDGLQLSIPQKPGSLLIRYKIQSEK